MKRFGPTPQFIDVEERVPVPVGKLCGHCFELIRAGDSGTIMPCVMTASEHGEPVQHGELVQHIECAARQALGSVGHQLRRCSCYGGTEDDPPNLNKRAAADAAWNLAECFRLLMKFHGTHENCVRWLETPHRELDDYKPISLIRDGRSEVVANMLHAAHCGIPT